MAYSLLLLHNLIPHCHTNPHDHTAGSQASSADHHHDHISHTDHSDHNAFDLLICFLEETEHTASGIDYSLYHYSETRTSFINTISGAKDFALPVSCFNTAIASEEQADLSFTKSPDYLSPSLLSQPARGPPLVS